MMTNLTLYPVFRPCTGVGKSIFLWGLIFLPLWLGLESCGGSSYSGERSLETKSVELDQSAQGEVQPQLAQQKLIRKAWLRIRIDDLSEAENRVVDLTQSLEGYISKQEQVRYNNRSELRMELRIPASNFEKALQEMEALAIEVDSREVEGQDVTEEFLDVSARLKNKRALEERYLELLERAKNVSEMLSVEQALSKVRQEIESAEGRMQFLENRVSYSTIFLIGYTQHPDSFGARLSKGWVNGWENLKDFVVGLVNGWPFLLILAVMVWGLGRWIRRRRRK